MGNPLVNELIINTPAKDGWNRVPPGKRGGVPGFLQEPGHRHGAQLVYGVPIVPINGSPASNRTDLMSILLKYPGQALAARTAERRARSCCGSTCAFRRRRRRTRAGLARR